MKILLLSDNHGQWPLVNDIVQNNKDKVDYIYHCGDSEFSDDDPIWLDIDAVVKGNMDYAGNYPDVLFLDSPVGKICLTHGHLFAINEGPETLYKYAHRHDAQIIFHGHTHALYADIYQGTLMVNPGSLISSRGLHSYRTYAIVEFTEDQIFINYYDHLQEHLADLSLSLSREQVGQ